MEMNLGVLFERAIRRHQDKIAIVDGPYEISFAELGRRANRVANALHKLGVEKGARAALLMQNCHQAIEIDAGLFKTGVVKVPLNARLSSRELQAIIADSGACIIFVHIALADVLLQDGDLPATVRHIVIIEGERAPYPSYAILLEGSSDEPVENNISPDDIYGLFYTSGTSGVLKAGMLTHKNWMVLTRANLMRGGSENAEDINAAYVAPITHAAGGAILANLIRGSKNILFRQFDPGGFLRAVEKQRITDVLLIPVMINMLLERPEIRECDLSSLRTITYGAAPMSPERIRQALDVFGPVLVQGYGQTESCAIISTLGKAEHALVDDPAKSHLLSSVGVPDVECEVRLVDGNGDDVPTGDIGEIIVRGDNVMKGYWNAPELTKDAIRNGWLHTRDMGRLDEDGYLYLVDRKSDMIITGGFNVYPTEVENVLYQHPAVYEVAVISVPDPKWGEGIKAAVVLKPGASATSDELIEFCRQSLAHYKAPKSIDFLNELPKSAVGKILRRVVREPYWQNLDRRIG
jgi:acyl-CoA synthetase (AMP-forming)/AMP-acid ligase II